MKRKAIAFTAPKTADYIEQDRPHAERPRDVAIAGGVIVGLVDTHMHNIRCDKGYECLLTVKNGCLVYRR